MGHNHQHDINSDAHISARKLGYTIALNIVITVSEFVGGILAGSLALISDAVHNLSDSISLVVSMIAIKIAGRSSSEQKTFGYERAEVVAAFINASVLIAICSFLIIEAVKRFYHPVEIKTGIMMLIAGIGLLANLFSVLLLKHSAAGSMNIRSSYLHLIGDTVSSIGVVIGGLLITYFHITWIDPLVTILISIYIGKESFGILWESLNIVMQGSPELDYAKLKQELESVEGVVNVHHVHCWMINDKKNYFEAHVDIDNIMISDTTHIHEQIVHILQEKYNIYHTTIQFECERCDDKRLIAGAKHKH